MEKKCYLGSVLNVLQMLYVDIPDDFKLYHFQISCYLEA